MDRKGYKAIALLLACIYLAGCKKDKPASVTNVPAHDTGNVYVVCEGNFGSGDASLYLYRPAQDSVYGDLYKAVNGQPLGDVFQSIVAIGSNLFLCINNSNKIEVISNSTWQHVGAIPVSQPRYILPVSSSKAYVSSLYSNKLYIIDPAAMQVTGTITLPDKNPEGMLLYDGFAYICTWDTASRSVYKINVLTDEIVQAIKLNGYAPQEVVIDREQKLWVLSGDQPEGKVNMLTRIDPSTGDILKTYQFASAANVIKPVFNNTRDTLYFIEANYNGGTYDNGIYRMAITDAALPAQPFIAAGQNQYFWGLGISPATGNIYVGDPKGFIQKGSVTVYRSDAGIVTEFNTGLGPAHFYFDE